MVETKIKEMIKMEIAEAKELFAILENGFGEKIAEMAGLCVDSLSRGHGIYLAGNGGSCADAEHFAAELVGNFLNKKRKGIRAVALSTSGAIVTSLSNDFGYNTVVARQLEALAKKDDIFIGISTGGNSENLLLALKKANEIGMKTISLLGKGGGRACGAATIEIIIPSQSTPRIQEAHLLILHLVAHLIENNFKDV